MTQSKQQWPLDLPLVAILRGLVPERAAETGQALMAAGFQLLEVPLNRARALESIARLIDLAPEGVLIGAGTVTTRAQVDAVAATGARLIVSPNMNPSLIAHAKALGMFVAPGVMTPSEAFTALEAGADALKIFPAESVGMLGLRAFASVLPPETHLWPVGGIVAENMAHWRRHGATGFGIGGSVFQPGFSADEVAERATKIITAWLEAGFQAADK